MYSSNLIQEIKKYAMHMAHATNHINLEVASSLKVSLSFVFKIRNKLGAAGKNVLLIAKRKKHLKWKEILLSWP